MVEFKQVIGRGTRLFADENEFWFTILDYVDATRMFYVSSTTPILMVFPN